MLQNAADLNCMGIKGIIDTLRLLNSNAFRLPSASIQVRRAAFIDCLVQRHRGKINAFVKSSKNNIDNKY